MQSDDIIWDCIGKGFCSFKKTTTTQTFCRNKYNATGLCGPRSCPQANSRYATILEEKGKCYLYMKVAERAHMPAKQWEKIELDKSLEQSTKQLEKKLRYWQPKSLKWCKERQKRYHQMLSRMRHIRLNATSRIVPYIRSKEKVLDRREKKAHKAAQIHDSIKTELLERLSEGMYGNLYTELVRPKVVVEEEQEKEDISDKKLEIVEAYEPEYDIEYDYDNESVSTTAATTPVQESSQKRLKNMRSRKISKDLP